MSEHLALAEQVDERAAVDELDGAAPDHPDPALRELPLGDDRGARGKNSTSVLRRQRLEGLLIESAEGIAPPQELGDVVHR